WEATISARSFGRPRSSARAARCSSRMSTPSGIGGSSALRASPGRGGSSRRGGRRSSPGPSRRSRSERPPRSPPERAGP
ncbi:MAG: hypothetical protein AVDCRST_MAG61-2646, partial [uncultured Friedmanniella sp.]